MNTQIRILQLGTHDEECGIAKYQEQFIDELANERDIHTEYFEYSPNQTKRMSEADQKEVFKKLALKLADFDILHIQHEISFFSRNELAESVAIAKRLQKKVMVTVHTAPDVRYVAAKLGGIGPRSILQFIKAYRRAKRFSAQYIEPLKYADLVLVHNIATKSSLEQHGVSSAIIKMIKIPVPRTANTTKSNEITRNLNRKKGDIIYCSVGFLSRNKGVIDAIKALEYLPSNYKLAIIGGNHPNSDDGQFYNEITDLIASKELNGRVYITGYIKEDDRLNSLIGECDVCVYPFNNAYYKYVSSASLNNAFANHKPVVAYPTGPFQELNAESQTITLCDTASYYELARKLSTLDFKAATAASVAYAEKYSYQKEAAKFAEIYRAVARGLV